MNKIRRVQVESSNSRDPWREAKENGLLSKNSSNKEVRNRVVTKAEGYLWDDILPLFMIGF